MTGGNISLSEKFLVMLPEPLIHINADIGSRPECLRISWVRSGALGPKPCDPPVRLI